MREWEGETGDGERVTGGNGKFGWEVWKRDRREMGKET